MIIALTGPRGLVGSRIAELLSDTFTFIPLMHDEVDITDSSSVEHFFETLEADIVLHLAAYTNVDGAETEPEIARAINVTGTKNIYQAATRRGMKMIHISTDFVFDGTNPPYDETSSPHPLGVYAKTKWEAEQYLFSKADNHQLSTINYQLPTDAMIVRITYPYRLDDFPKKDFVRTIKWLLEEGRSVAGITDSYITPTLIDDVAMGLKYLITHFSNEVFHLVGGESVTPHTVFELIAKKWNLDPTLISEITFDEYFKGKAPRPKLGKTVSVKNTFTPMQKISDVLG